MPEPAYSGVIVPLVTPFTGNGKIDAASLGKIVRYVVKNNCHPFVLGTTGESASIDFNNFSSVATVMVKAADGKCTTYAGVSSNNFSTTLDLARQMKDAGVDAVVAHPPSYYPISGMHIQKYYETIADAVNMPLLIYNIPATTHHSIPLDVVEKLSYHPNIVGIKDSERNFDRLKKSVDLWSSRDDFVHLLGWGAQLTDALLLGSDGIVPSTGNITPYLYQMMYQSAKEGNAEDARYLQKITDQFSAIYQQERLLSDSLSALKVLLNEIGLCGRSVLPPLTELEEEDVKILVKKMRELMHQMKNDSFGKDIIWP